MLKIDTTLQADSGLGCFWITAVEIQVPVVASRAPARPSKRSRSQGGASRRDLGDASDVEESRPAFASRKRGFLALPDKQAQRYLPGDMQAACRREGQPVVQCLRMLGQVGRATL